MNIPDPLDLFEQRDREQQNWLKNRPKCDYCDEPIQDDHFYDINGDFICPDCLESYFRKEVDDYAD